MTLSGLRRRAPRVLKMLLGALVLLVLGIGCLLLYPPFPVVRLVRGFAPSAAWYGSTERPEIAITFDDGPDPRNTPRVLEQLKAHGVKATFFLIGANASRYPELVVRIKAEGHQVANHFWEDRGILGWDEARLTQSLSATEAVVRQETTPKFLRAPGGRFGPTLVAWAQRNGYVIVQGSVYPHDPHGLPVWYIRGMVCSLMRNGSIIVLHDGGGDRSPTLEALPGILACARERGLRFVTVRELAG